MIERRPLMRIKRHRNGGIRWCLLVGILLLAAFFRLYRMPGLPWGLSQDEVVNANISLGVLAGEGAPFLAGGFLDDQHRPFFPLIAHPPHLQDDQVAPHSVAAVFRFHPDPLDHAETARFRC